MKRVLVDIYKTKEPFSGLGQFSLNFFENLAKAYSNLFELHFLQPQNFKNEEGSNFSSVKASFQKRYLPFLNDTFHIWHSLHQFPSHFPNSKTHQILTIHDLNFLEEKSVSKGQNYLKRLQKNVDRANTITAISHYTKSVAKKHLDLKGKPIHVIHNGVFLKEFPNCQKPSFINSKPYFFSIGILSAKKNFHKLLPLIKRFPKHQLIIAGKKDTSYGNELQQRIKDEKLSSQVILCGKVSDKDKYWLYMNCEAFWFPSKAEGFGLPAIEAMLCGKPVFLSKYGSLPEIGGDHAFYWDNFEVDHMEKVVQKNLDDFKQGSALVEYAQTFGWERAIEEYKNLYAKILKS